VSAARVEPELFCVVAPGLEFVCVDEAREHGFHVLGHEVGGVRLRGDPTEALRANLSLAVPTRVLERIARFEARDFGRFEREVRAIDWARFGTGFTPRAACHKSKLHHTGALESRLAQWLPAGDTALLARFDDDVCTLSLDTTGERLHKRGWRVEVGPAPLRETLAAGLLRLAGWAPGEALYDPMCGSGTFVIEAAGAAGGLLPGRLRTFACEARLGPGARGAAESDPRSRRAPVPTLIGASDRAKPAVDAARRNAERAGVGGAVGFSVLEAAHAVAPASAGLLVCNLPYDRRAGGARHAVERLGLALRGSFRGWRAAVLTPERSIEAALARRVRASFPIDNGGLSVRWWLLEAET
jgi:putative N6-adenine-specific DNA methylase